MRLWKNSKSVPVFTPQPFVARPHVKHQLNTSIARLGAEARLFSKFGIGKSHILQAARLAHRNGTTIERELLAGGIVARETYYEALAEYLGLPYLAKIDSCQLHLAEAIDTQLTRGPLVRVNRQNELPVMVFSPEAANTKWLAQRLRRTPRLAERLAVASPQTIRNAIWAAGGPRRLRQTVNSLFDTKQPFSARIVFSGAQGLALGAAMTAALVLAILFTRRFFLSVHIFFSAFYFLTLLARGWALSADFTDLAALPSLPPPEGVLPIYTVLVALYREEKMIPQLVAALNRLDWPKSLLDIKLVCEADDRATIEALRKRSLGEHFEIVTVPAGGPRTKPKALTYALNAARGEFLVIYDAEDRPHPGQLKEAFNRFREAGTQLACLQSPLVMSNADTSRISAIFALEYAALFRKLLPLMAHLRMPMPLGGTSNHFRTAVLTASGAWDPFNVTEDADLGLRLKRMGYDCGVLLLPTLEDAPSTWKVWLAQRSRWFKGWLQTLLVHFRDPLTLFKQIGLAGYLALMLSIGGMLFSALVHPLIIYFLINTGWLLANVGPKTTGELQVVLFIVDGFNILGSYTLFAVLGCEPMTKAERRRLGSPWTNIPSYWLMLSWAAWKALMEIRRSPFLWRKTPHEPSSAGTNLKTARQGSPATGNSAPERPKPPGSPATSSPAR